jgi:hypothetical protein
MALSVICKQSAVRGQDRVEKRRTGLQDSQRGVRRIVFKEHSWGPQASIPGEYFLIIL